MSALKPCILTLVEGTVKLHGAVLSYLIHPLIQFLISHFALWYVSAEEYDDERATAHVRRVLDLVACTTSFGPSSPSKDQNSKPDSPHSAIGAKNALGAQDKNAKKSSTTKSQGFSGAKQQDAAVDTEAEMSHSLPKLGSFYEFFSLSHLTPPIQCTYTFSLCIHVLYINIARFAKSMCFRFSTYNFRL